MKKNIYKNVIYIITLIALSGVIFMGCKKEESDIVGKTYKGKAAGYKGDVIVEVTVGDDYKINAINVNAKKEIPEIGGAAAPQVAKQIIAEQSLAVDTISGATMTSLAVITATENALKEAGVDTESLKKK